MERCGWVGTEEIYEKYHDEEWGIPQYNSRALWEQITLESFQSGLSWITILRKREGFRAAFAGFDPDIVAEFDETDVERLLLDTGIVRHRGKITATINNARVWQKIEAREGFANFLWAYVDRTPIQNERVSLSDVPGQTPLSAQISKDLKKEGFKFCGPTTVYAFMQASGMVNDHLISCPSHALVKALPPMPR